MTHPNEWGRHAWTWLHYASFGLPETPTPAEQAAALAQLHALSSLLPCSACRDHYRAMLAASPPEPHVGSGEAFARYIVDLHNRVNVRLGKPEVDFEAARAMYGDALCSDDCGEEAVVPLATTDGTDATACATAVPWPWYVVAALGLVLLFAVVAYAISRSPSRGLSALA
jgi:hypothetical protein